MSKLRPLFRPMSLKLLILSQKVLLKKLQLFLKLQNNCFKNLLLLKCKISKFKSKSSNLKYNDDSRDYGLVWYGLSKNKLDLNKS
jgi:hypothetical protein